MFPISVGVNVCLNMDYDEEHTKIDLDFETMKLKKAKKSIHG